ncbi:ABC transporter permease [Fructobacillus sp. M1-13]|uniref:ABC transporter permease n=1 Tax=Fructobacillus papyriferae TaxID=2713171 RepID=A0ABS5QPL2_9LACO|nr:ABC transporter permease [Fructobacillus papyriferae]MBS9335108.1 ABC transporter permease [Fructobacillus papyriferae]MCD2159406.1 ABC transporter permease [Fructobacillus papyriferae]
MNKQMSIVAKHTYKTRIKKKSFWWLLLTPLAPVLVGGIVGLAVAAFSSNNTADIAVIAPEEVRQAIQHEEKSLNLSVSSDQNEDKARKSLEKETIDGVLIVKDNEGTLLTQPKSEEIKTENLQNLLSKITVSKKAQKYKLTQAQVQDLQTPFKLTAKVQDKNASKDSDAADTVKSMLTMAVGVLVFIIVSIYASIIGNEIANEKSSRIMETLLAASSAKAQYYGKIVGVAGLLLTQIGIYAVVGTIGTVVTMRASWYASLAPYLSALTPGFWIFTLLFVLISTASYLVLSAITASLVNDQSQISQAMTPISMLALIPYIVAISSSSTSGQNLFIQALSYVPLMGQSIMPSQLANNYATWWQASLSLVLALLALVLLLHFGLALYKKNVLSYSEENITKQLLAGILPHKKHKRHK